MKRKIKAGVVQFDVKNGRIDANMERVMENIEQLAGQGADLAVLPELFSCGFEKGHVKECAAHTPMVLDRLCNAAAQRKMAISGSLPEQEKGQVFNTHYFIDADGEIKGYYRKLHLFPLTGEDGSFTAGNRMVAIDTSLGKIGLMICYDLRFPELARNLCLQDVMMILVPAQWPLPRIEHWACLVQARAIENQLYMVCANRTGKDGDLVFPGHSMIVDPLGKVVTLLEEDRSCAFGDIDFQQIEKARQMIPCMAGRRGDIYG